MLCELSEFLLPASMLLACPHAIIIIIIIIVVALCVPYFQRHCSSNYSSTHEMLPVAVGKFSDQGYYPGHLLDY